MLYRAALFLLTGFWITMTILLWQAEFGARKVLGSLVPVAVVAEKILTAPDASSLSIFQEGKRVGFCHWATSVGEGLSETTDGDAPPEGMVRRITGYKVQLEGNIVPGDGAKRLRFECNLSLGGNHDWRELGVKLHTLPLVWELHSVADERAVTLTMDDGEFRSNRTFRFSELENPEELIGGVAGPFAAGLWSSLGVPFTTQNMREVVAALHWEARNSTVEFGHSTMPAYRLEARLLDRYRGVIFVSRVGEILRVELPNGVRLINDQLNAL